MKYAADTLRIFKLAPNRFAVCVEGDAVGEIWQNETKSWTAYNSTLFEDQRVVLGGPFSTRQEAVDCVLAQPW